VACDDGSLVPQWLGLGSHVTTDLNIKREVKRLTIEYWFHIGEARGTMLSVVDAAGREVLSINKFDGIECAFNNS
jgi:hypothetical protein